MTEKKEKVKKIGLLHVLGWIIGVMTALSGIIWLTQSVIAGVLMIFAGMIIIPKTNEFFKKKYNIDLSRWLRVVIFLILVSIATALLISTPLYTTLYGRAAPAGVVKVGNSAPKTNEPVELTLDIGETASTSTLKVTILSAELKRFYTYRDMFGGSSVNQAEAGKMWLLAEAEIEYIGPSSIYLSSTAFTAADSERYRYDLMQTTYSLAAIPDELDWLKELYTGQKTKGKILFEVPKNATGLKIQYNFAAFDVKLASWKVN